jgi:hypothetical protein
VFTQNPGISISGFFIYNKQTQSILHITSQKNQFTLSLFQKQNRMKHFFTVLICISMAGAAGAQSHKDSLLRELSGILEKAAGTSWKDQSVTKTIVKQTLSGNTITLVMKEKGYFLDEAIDRTTTTTYRFVWDSLKKISTQLPDNPFVLAGCSEADNYCQYQLSFPDKQVSRSRDNGKPETANWFYVYMRPADKDRYFACLQKLYAVLRPGK